MQKSHLTKHGRPVILDFRDNPCHTVGPVNPVMQRYRIRRITETKFRNCHIHIIYIQRSNLDEKRMDGKRIYNYRQWLERLKQHRKEKTDIGSLIKEEETMTGTEWDTKEENIQQVFLGMRSNTTK